MLVDHIVSTFSDCFASFFVFEVNIENFLPMNPVKLLAFYFFEARNRLKTYNINQRKADSTVRILSVSDFEPVSYESLHS